MVRIYFADQGTRDQLHRTLREAMAELDEQMTDILGFAPVVASGSGHFPNRLHITAFVVRQTIGLIRARLEFLQWAASWISDWEDTAVTLEKSERVKALLQYEIGEVEGMQRTLRDALEHAATDETGEARSGSTK
jgi:hypothetical protein